MWIALSMFWIVLHGDVQSIDIMKDTTSGPFNDKADCMKFVDSQDSAQKITWTKIPNNNLIYIGSVCVPRDMGEDLPRSIIFDSHHNSNPTMPVIGLQGFLDHLPPPPPPPEILKTLSNHQ